MPAITSTAPGKIILFGEHSVVYGKPAIAVPVQAVRARAVVMPDIAASSGRVLIQAPDIGLEADLDRLPDNHHLRVIVILVLNELGITRPPALRLRVSSTIPIASGMGSGAAIAVASIRAISSFLGSPLSDERVSSLAFEVEKLHHGTPSGIDNTVITFQQPVFFQRTPQGNRVETLDVANPFPIVIGDTGVRSSTAKAVGELRSAWQRDQDFYEGLFYQVGEIVEQARQLIQTGNSSLLGRLMDENHALLQAMGVSSEALDQLVEAARQAGAKGAKLSGGGRGGNMIALTEGGQIEQVVRALKLAGAVRVLETVIG
jgi:mevalonate kinase